MIPSILIALLTTELTAPPSGSDPPAKVDRYGDPLPPGAIARLGTVRFRAGFIRATGLSADGKTLRTISVGPDLRTWDVATGRLLSLTRLPTGGDADHFSASKDGSVVYLPGTGFLDTILGKVLSNPPMPQRAQVSNMTLSRDGRRAYVHLDQDVHDHVAMVWDTATGKSRKLILKGEEKYVNAVLHPAGDRLTVLYQKRTECIEIESGRVVWTVDRPARDSHVFAPDGKTFVVCIYGENGDTTWEVWDMASGALRGIMARPDLPFASIMSISPDGRFVTVALQRGYMIWEPAAKRIVAQNDDDWAKSRFTPDSKSVIFAGAFLQRYELPSGRPVYPDTRGHGHSGRVTNLAFSPNSRRLASIGVDKTLRMWDVTTATAAGELRIETWDGNEMLSFSPDGTKVLCVAKETHICDANPLKASHCLQTKPPKDWWARVAAATWADDRKIVGHVRMTESKTFKDSFDFVKWDSNTGKIEEKLPAEAGNYGFVKWGNVVFPLSILSQRAGWGLHDVAAGKIAVNFGFGNMFMVFSASAVSSDGSLVAGYCLPHHGGLRRELEKPFVAIWDSAMGQKIVTLPIEDGWRLAFTGDGRRLVAVGTTELTVWDIAKAVRVRTHSIPNPPGRRSQSNTHEQCGVECLAVTKDGKTAATGHADGTILMWDLSPLPTGAVER